MHCPRYVAILALVAGLLPSAANADSRMRYISASGTDGGAAANTCTNPTNPCQTLAWGISHTPAGGELVVLSQMHAQAGGVAFFTINKSITIHSAIPGGLHIQAFAYIGPPNFSIVTHYPALVIAAGPGDRVILDGLDIDVETQFGDGSLPQADGIRIDSGGEVFITNTNIRNISSAGFAAVAMKNATATRLTLDHVKLVGNAIGVKVASTPGSGHVKIFNSLLLANATAGVQVIGSGNDALLFNNQLLGSAKAIDLQSGGVARSYGSNIITNGDSPTSLPPL